MMRILISALVISSVGSRSSAAGGYVSVKCGPTIFASAILLVDEGEYEVSTKTLKLLIKGHMYEGLNNGVDLKQIGNGLQDTVIESFELFAKMEGVSGEEVHYRNVEFPKMTQKCLLEFAELIETGRKLSKKQLNSADKAASDFTDSMSRMISKLLKNN
jgi:hypothetical protein